jgi:hypothetical protein
MKKCISVFIILCLLLSGCGSNENATQWPSDMIAVAPFLAVEPIEGYAFGESADTLGLGGVYYATWTSGDVRDFVNSKGESAVIFDSQIYIIVQEARTEEDAKTTQAQWIAREQQNYECGDVFPLTVNGRDYSLLPLISGDVANPYNFGYAAFTTYGTNTICAELVCSDTFSADPQAVMEQFLNSLHYSE